MVELSDFSSSDRVEREQLRKMRAQQFRPADPGPSLTPGASYKNTTPCALVLEDNPVGEDSRLYFDSFPQDGIEQAYNLAPYKELGQNRMAQPGYVTYQGGDWAPFPLELKFVAGQSLAGATPSSISPTDLEDILTEMEAKVNWVQAACFPLERVNAEAGRILAKMANAGQVPTAATTEAAGKLKRVDPPVVLIVFGSWRIIRGLMTNFRVNWSGPFHPTTVQPYVAQVKVAFKPVMIEYPTWESIRFQHGAKGQGLNTSPGVRGSVDISSARVADEARRARAQRFQDNTAALGDAGILGFGPTPR